MMARRSCANCHAKEWIDYRYCDDCWRAMVKSAAAVLGTAVTSWFLHWLTL